MLVQRGCGWQRKRVAGTLMMPLGYVNIMLTFLVIRACRFFNLPEDLTVQNCLDAADEYIEVQAGGRSQKADGYCVENRAFRAIVDRLYAHKRRFTNN